MSIAGGTADPRVITSILSTLVHLDPFQVMGSGELGFSWIAEILKSKYSENERYRMTSQVVQSLRKYFYSEDLDYTAEVQPTFVHLGVKLLPILAVALSPTDPPQPRCSALKVFHRFMSVRSSSPTEMVADEGLENLLQAVGDPFLPTPGLPPYSEQPAAAVAYDPMMAVVVLIEFASSDLWRNHLPPSSFGSCERFVLTEEGKRTALRCMDEAATHEWFLSTPQKVTAAIRHLEELPCPQITEVVRTWTQTARPRTE